MLGYGWGGPARREHGTFRHNPGVLGSRVTGIVHFQVVQPPWYNLATVSHLRGSRGWDTALGRPVFDLGATLGQKMRTKDVCPVCRGPVTGISQKYVLDAFSSAVTGAQMEDVFLYQVLPCEHIVPELVISDSPSEILIYLRSHFGVPSDAEDTGL